MKQLIEILVFTLLSAVLFDNSLACGGYQIKMNYVRTNGTLINILKDMTLSVNQKCDVSIKVCHNIEAYRTLNVKYTIFQNNFKVLSEEDYACGSKKTFTLNYDMYGIPKTCPTKQTHFCNDEPQIINLMKMKRIVKLLAGNYTVECLFSHDKLQSWLTYDFKVYKV